MQFYVIVKDASLKMLSDPVTVESVSSTTSMTARTGNWQEIMLQWEASAATTQAQSETRVVEPVHLHVADLVGKDSIIAITAGKDDSYDRLLPAESNTSD